MKTIAVYIGTLPTEKKLWEGKEQLKYELIERLLFSKEINCILIADEPVEELFSEQKPLQIHYLGKRPHQSLSLQHFINHKLLSVLKKINVEYFFSLEGISPKKYKGNSVILIPDNVTNKPPNQSKDSFLRFQNKHLGETAEKAMQLITLSGFTKEYLITHFKISEDKIEVLQPLFNKNRPSLEWEEREDIKERYAKGKEYLLYLGDFMKKAPILTLLKAFSLLKRKMNSGMVLVLAGKQEPTFKKFHELIRTFHFGKDVKLVETPSLKESADLISGAYVVVIPSSEVGFCSRITEILQAHTPAIVPKDSIHEAIGGERVWSFTENDLEELGNRFCDLYKDEESRSKLIQQAEIQSTQFSKETETALFFDILNHLY